MEWCSFLFSFLLLSALCTSSQASAAQLNQTQANLLGKLFEILQSDLSVPSDRLNYGINTNRCNWTGVTCVSLASSEVVSKLSFSDLGISSFNSSSLAPFFDHLCSLDTLQYLDLSSNDLRSLPDSFSNCTGLSGLKYLNLSNTLLYSPIPDLSKFGHLEILDLSSNYLPNHINLDPLIRLESLNLSFNQFKGMALPLSSSQENGSLKELVLSRYSFTGEIPDGIFKHGNLTLLDLSNNQLTGSIPKEFNNLTKLEILLLNENNFIGSIPSSFFSNSAQLEIVDLSHNNFSGPVPDSLTTLHSLTHLDLSDNNFSGTLPTFHSWVNVIITGNALLSYYSSQVSQTKRNMHPSLGIILFFELGAFLGIFVGIFLGTYGFDKFQFDRS